MVFWLVIATFGLALLAFFSSLFALAVTRVPVLRTPAEALAQIRAALELQPGQVVVDAGCADARTLIALCEANSVRGRGYELNGPVWLVAWLRVALGGRSGQIRIFWKDFFRSDLEDVDLVYCYLMPGLMTRVAHKCLAEMAPGGRLVSFHWAVPDWEPDRILHLGRAQDPVYLYRLPAPRGGSAQPLESRKSPENKA